MLQNIYKTNLLAFQKQLFLDLKKGEKCKKHPDEGCKKVVTIFYGKQLNHRRSTLLDILRWMTTTIKAKVKQEKNMNKTSS